VSRAFQGRVLVVDDDPLLRRIFERALQRLGVDAVIVSDGDAAVAAAQSEAFTLALIDLDLGGGAQGGDVVERLRLAQVAPPTFVCISGSVMASKSAPTGAFAGFERKPATVDEMSALLSRWNGDASADTP
jgi:CheY-like chemotaxis protein